MLHSEGRGRIATASVSRPRRVQCREMCVSATFNIALYRGAVTTIPRYVDFLVCLCCDIIGSVQVINMICLMTHSNVFCE